MSTAPPLHAAPEIPVLLLAEGKTVASWLCSPRELEALAAGWLLTEGIIASAADLLHLQADADAGIVRIELAPPAARLLEERRRAAVQGMGGLAELRAGLAAGPSRLSPALEALLADPARLSALFRMMFDRGDLRRLGGGVHSGGLVAEGELLRVVEDVGRHNVVDKLIGWALLSGRESAGALLILSGRVSGLMAAKASRAGVAAVATISIPTTLAREIAGRTGVTLVGRARREAPQIHWARG